MLIYSDGTVFNAPVKTFVNTVNCSGVMGAGIALEFKLRYPEMFSDYIDRCNKKNIVLGKPQIYEYTSDIWIMNFPTKGNWRFPSKIQWIEQGLKYFVDNYKARDIESIAFPKLGTSNGGLEWEDVKPLMETYLSDLNINVYICLDEKQEAEGSEKRMLDILNNMTLDDFINKVKLTRKQAEVVFSHIPYLRFWHISKIDKIGKKSYETIFKYFYNKVNQSNKMSSNNDEWVQLSIFDLKI